MLKKIIGLKKEKFPYLQLMGLFIFVLLIFGVAGLFSGTVFAETGKSEQKTSTLKVCAECHDDLAVKFKGSLHNAVKADCSDCHGDYSKHVESGEAGTIFAFKNEKAIQKSKICLDCHVKTTGLYMSGEHAKAGLDCTKCHGIHKKSHSGTMLNTKICASCHQDVVSQFQLNEKHRLKEGILQCTSCHNPHEPATRQRLGGFKEESCLKCHRDKSGPFIYEHEASKVEGCTICHDVHGSPNRHMLKHQSVRELCFSCHSAAPDWHLRFLASDTNCANCHSTIHGSNLDKLFLK